MAPRGLHDNVVVCAGVGSRALARGFGDRVNVYPVKGYSITVNLHDHASQDAAPNLSLLDDDAKIVTSRLGRDRFRIAGTAEFNGYTRDIRMDRIRPLIGWCEQVLPGGVYRTGRSLGRSASDDAQYDASGRPRKEPARLLQYRAWPFGLDTVRRNRGNDRSSRRWASASGSPGLGCGHGACVRAGRGGGAIQPGINLGRPRFGPVSKRLGQLGEDRFGCIPWSVSLPDRTADHDMVGPGGNGASRARHTFLVSERSAVRTHAPG